MTDDRRTGPTWRARAACRGVDPDIFFPERGASTREAKEVCATCHVRDECLEYALDAGEKHGIYGGKSEKERRSIRRRRRNAERTARVDVNVTGADMASEAARRDTVHRLYRSGMTAAAVAATGISESTVWRLLRRAA